MPETEVPRDQQPMPNTAFGRLNQLIAVAFHLISGNPRLLLFLGLNAAVNIVIFWIILNSVADDPSVDPAAGDYDIAAELGISAVRNLPLHFFQCSLMVATLATLRGETVTTGDAFRTARARILPLTVLALLTTVLGSATQLLARTLAENNAGIVSIPIVLAWLSWFAVDLLAVALVADTPGSVMAYLAGAGRLIRRTWTDALTLLLLFLLTTIFVAPILVDGITSGIDREEPSMQAKLFIASASTIIHNLILSFIYVYGARLYIYAVTSR